MDPKCQYCDQAMSEITSVVVMLRYITSLGYILFCIFPLTYSAPIPNDIAEPLPPLCKCIFTKFALPTIFENSLLYNKMYRYVWDCPPRTEPCGYSTGLGVGRPRQRALPRVVRTLHLNTLRLHYLSLAG